MKKLLTLSLIAILGGLIVLPTPIRAQEEVKKEKKVRIKTVKEIDGKKVETDTTFFVTDDTDFDEIKEWKIKTEGDEITVDVSLDSDGKTEDREIIILKGSDIRVSGNGHDAYFFQSEGGEGTAVVKWVDDEGKEMEFNIDLELESVMEELEQLQKDMEVEIKVLDGEQIIIMKELKDVGNDLHNIELEVLTEMDDIRGIGEYEIKMPGAPPHPGFHYLGGHSNKVSDVELRDAGIKNKPDRLDAQEIELEIEDGVVDFYFKLSEEGNPKVIVYNIYGDKVFSAKPEKMNGKFSLRMDLSKKQHGTYYLQVVMGSSSFTEKFRL